MADPYEIVAINRDDCVAITSTGGELPISKFLDRDGNECEDGPEAVMAICGFDYTWMWVDLRDFSGTKQ